MNRLFSITTGWMLSMMTATAAWAGDASTTAWADNGWTSPGSAGATANYNGDDDGVGFARTRTRTGNVNLARGVAVGFDRDGLDLSLSHAFAPKFGPAYAGTFNLSIGADGQVSGGYGGVLARGGESRSVEAGGVTSSHDGQTQVITRGNTAPGGTIDAGSRTFSKPRQPRRDAKPSHGRRDRRSAQRMSRERRFRG
jgi:hypothetical protein